MSNKTKSSTSSEMEPPMKARKLDNGEEMARDIDKNTQDALEQIDSCQAEIDEINEKASTEILKVEQKFNGLRKPLFDRRASIIQKIPNFWMTAMINHPHISILLEEAEEETLQHLKSLEVEECQDIKSGYRIHLHFNENPFFTNSVLTKEFKLGMTGEGDPKSSSTTIQWKKDTKTNSLYELLNPADSPSQPSSSGMANGKMKRNRRRSFFTWFLDNQDPSGDDTAEAIKDDLWPNPLHYYMTPDIELDDEGDDDDEVDDEEDIDDEELDEENLEEEEDDEETK